MVRQHIVVIGGGLAGCLLCNELVERFDVTLLEKGPQEGIRYPEFQFTKKKLAEVHTCCYGSGGTTNLWHNGLIPINLEDVEGSDFLEILKDADSFMDRCATALFFPDGSFRAEYERRKTDVNALSPLFRSFTHGIDCLIYPKSYKKLSVSAGVAAKYSVDDITFATQDGQVEAVDFRNGSGRQSIRADTVIVAAGTLGTPGLLRKIMGSCQHAADEQAVGQGFMDHPMGFVGKVKVKKEIAPLIKKLSAWNHGNYVSRNPVRLKSPCGKYSACVFFRPALTMDNRLSIYKYKSTLGANNGAARLKAIFSWKLFHPDIIAEIYAHLFGVTLPSRVYNILFIAEQHRGTNRVFEENGRIHVDWSISEEEITVYRAMLKEFAAMLDGLSDEVRIKTDLSDEWLWSAAHHSGTTSLGPLDGDLVDRNLRLRCCSNVYVCDGSVLQQHSYANTGLAIGQLALRLADRIKHEE